MSLAPYVRVVARGKGRARSPSVGEAHEAMTMILSGAASSKAVGAPLMVLRLRGETDAEIAGFTSALRASGPAIPTADLDWPCYAVARTRGAPLFLLAAKLVAQARYTVSLHGWNSNQNPTTDLRKALNDLGLIGQGLGYCPLETIYARAYELLRLRDTFGLRSCINTVLRMWNPSNAPVSVQGVFHTSYRGLQSHAAGLLGDQKLTVIKGGGGEFEANPAKGLKVVGLRDGTDIDETVPALFDVHRKVQDPNIDINALWRRHIQDGFSEAVIVKTAAVALWILKAATSVLAADMARDLWGNRHENIRRSA